jgi:hypothetical protein
VHEERKKRHARNRHHRGPSGVVGLSRSGIRGNHALDPTALCAPAIAPARRAYLRYAPQVVLLCALRHIRRERGVCRLFALPEDSVLATMGGGAGSSGVVRIDVGSSHSSSSRSAESAEIMGETLTAGARRLGGRILMLNTQLSGRFGRRPRRATLLALNRRYEEVSFKRIRWRHQRT